MEKIFFNGSGVYLDFALAARSKLGVISFYDRSLQAVKSFGASLTAHPFEKHLKVGAGFFLGSEEFDTYIQPVCYGKEKFYHGISINRSVGKEFFLCTRKNKERQLYDFLMTNYDLPLMQEWSGELLSYMENYRLLSTGQELIVGEQCRTDFLPIGGKMVPLEDLQMVLVSLDAETLNGTINNLFRQGRICITPEKQKSLSFTDMDSYFKEYGPTLVKKPVGADRAVITVRRRGPRFYLKVETALSTAVGTGKR